MGKIKSSLLTIITLVTGTGCMAVAIACIYEPIGMITGGFSGVAIIIKRVTETIIPGGVPLGISNFVLNIPVFLWALKKKNRMFLLQTAGATLLLSLWLSVLPNYNPVSDDFVLSSLLGGILSGTGVGLVLRSKAATGGTDLLAVLLHPIFPHRTVVELLMIIDGVIVAVGFGIFGLRCALYAFIAIYLTTKISDQLTEGIKYAKGALIITAKEDAIADAIMEHLEHGVTRIYATGMYQKQQKGMLYCVVPKKEIVSLKELIYARDVNAFVTVMDVREVFGEGFFDYYEEK